MILLKSYNFEHKGTNYVHTFAKKARLNTFSDIFSSPADKIRGVFFGLGDWSLIYLALEEYDCPYVLDNAPRSTFGRFDTSKKGQ